ncbi:MAG: hypothetical protein ACYCZ2_15020 [Lutibacter sp.]
MILLNSIYALSQNKVDSLILDIYKKSIDDRIVVRSSESKLFISYKFCEDWEEEIDYLINELTENQNSELINDENGTLNLIGLLSELSKNNTKEFANSQIDNLIKKETKMISYGCSDAFTSLTLKEYYLKLLTEPNIFILTNFSFNQNEIKLIKEKIE